MLRVALCDDETKVLDEVSAYITQYAQNRAEKSIETVCFNSARSLKSALDDGKLFDFFVLDIYIGDELGTLLAKDIRRRGMDHPIIFLTTSLEHAPESFETATLRYLLKPLDPIKFFEAIDAAMIQLKKQQDRQIKLKTENGVESINVNHIMYSEAHAHYQYITLENGTQLKVRMTVAELYTALAKKSGFARVGSAYIINLRNIQNVSANEVHLYHNISIPVPRGKYAEIKKAFWDFQYER